MTGASSSGRAKRAAGKSDDEQGAALAVPASSEVRGPDQDGDGEVAPVLFPEDRLGYLREMLLQGSPEQLAELREVLGSLPVGAFASIDDGLERRGFAVASDLLLDGELYTPKSERLAQLTEAQFIHLHATGTVSGSWDEGKQHDG